MRRWLLLRGLGRDARHWGDFPVLLRSTFPADTVQCHDLPGNGTRCDESSPTSIGHLVAGLQAEMGATRPWHVVALSLGGMVAAEWARRHPASVAALTLINTSMRPHCRFDQRLRPSTYGRLLGALWPFATPGHYEAAVLALTSRRPSGPWCDALLERWTQWHRDAPVTRANLLRQLIAAARYRDGGTPPPVPTRILASAGDGLVSPRCSHALADAWRLPLSEHPWAGHDLPLDDPDWVIGQLRRLPQLPGRGSSLLPPVVQDA